MHNVVQYEQKRDAAVETSAAQVLLSLERTVDHLRREIHLLLRNFGLTSTQFNALRILQNAGAEGLTCSALGSRLISADPDITRLLDRLAKQGLVRRHRDSRDRRVVLTEITEAGETLLATIGPQLDARVREMFSHMSPERTRLLSELLAEARQDLQHSRQDLQQSNVQKLPEGMPIPTARAG